MRPVNRKAAAAPPESTTGKKFQKRISRILAENQPKNSSAKTQLKKNQLARSQPKNCVSRNLAITKFDSGI